MGEIFDITSIVCVFVSVADMKLSLYCVIYYYYHYSCYVLGSPFSCYSSCFPVIPASECVTGPWCGSHASLYGLASTLISTDAVDEMCLGLDFFSFLLMT